MTVMELCDEMKDQRKHQVKPVNREFQTGWVENSFMINGTLIRLRSQLFFSTSQT